MLFGTDQKILIVLSTIQCPNLGKKSFREIQELFQGFRIFLDDSKLPFCIKNELMIVSKMKEKREEREIERIQH